MKEMFFLVGMRKYRELSLSHSWEIKPSFRGLYHGTSFNWTGWVLSGGHCTLQQPTPVTTLCLHGTELFVCTLSGGRLHYLVTGVAILGLVSQPSVLDSWRGRDCVSGIEASSLSTCQRLSIS